MVDLDKIIDQVLTIEGGYSHNSFDSGGETNWGVTEVVARSYGYKGPMKAMTKDQARELYKQYYIIGPGFDKVLEINKDIGSELIDTGVNCGQLRAGIFLQRSLNAMNNRGQDFPDLKIDGVVGPATLYSLTKFLHKRGASGEVVMLRCLNVLQGAHYIELVNSRQKDERFIFGWFLNRIVI